MTQTELTPIASLKGKRKPYPAYKDSGVEWLGEIPAHWGVKRIAMVAQKITNGYVGPTRDIFVDDGIRYLQSLHIKHGEIRFNKPYYVTEEWSNAHAKSILQEGDILVVQTGDIGQCCAVSKKFAGCNCHALIIVQLRQEFGSGFYLSKFLRSDYGRNALQCAQTGALHPHLECGKLREIKVLLPPPVEQNEIINFLDHETARINALIAKKKRLIELLQEKRAALISHAVTKGLDPTVPMKDSGVEWLGEIPAHWRVMKIALAAKKITNGYVGPTRDILVNEGVRYLQSLHIKNGEIRFDKPYYVTHEWSNAHVKSILCEGDVLVVQTGDIGQCSAVSKEFVGCNCHALIIIQLKDGLGSGFYLSAFLRSDYGHNMLLYYQTGALHPHLECGNVREIRILLPPTEEQTQIMDYLAYEIAKIDALVSRIREGVEKLREYSTALISAAVTGKIDVREEILSMDDTDFKGGERYYDIKK
jgi:type I restriction enzyme, S subunit